MTSEDKLLIFDVETTGINTTTDQVIELAIQKGLAADSERKARRFKPSVNIPPAATAVHGITDADVAECPPFRKVTESVRKIFAEANVIVGYNVKFDIEMLQAEFKRAGAAPLDLTGKQIIDPCRLWSRCEPRKLEDAVKRFAKREHEGAHSALADVSATGEVLTGMLIDFGIAEQSWSELAEFIEPGRKDWVGDTHHLQWKDQTVVFGFGKHQGKCVCEVIKADGSYLRWISGKDFPAHVIAVLTKAQELEKLEFVSWAQTSFRISE